MILQLTNEALEQKLKPKRLEYCYFLGSQEAILLQEAKELIWSIAQKQGFQTRHILDMSLPLDWEQLCHQYNTADLFAAHQLIEFNCPKLPNESIGQKLQQFVDDCHLNTVPHRMIIITCNQFSSNAAQPIWFKQILKGSTAIFLPSPTQYALPQWIKQRAYKKGLSLTQAAVFYLAQGTEGNINATIQSIEKLALLYGTTDKPLNTQDLQNIFEDQAQFAIFTLNESILQNDNSRILRILSHFETCNIAPALVLGCVLRLVRSMAALCYGQSAQPLALLFKTNNIWPKHQAPFKQALSLIQKNDFYVLFNHAHQIDRQIKGIEKGDIWRDLQRFCLKVTQYFR